MKTLKNLALTLTALISYLHIAQGACLPLDLGSKEYKSLMVNIKSEESVLKNILAAGERNLKWVELINSQRPQEQWILLSSKKTQIGIPMDHPKFYNEEIILNEYRERLAAASPLITKILMGTQDLPANPPVDDASFAATAIEINHSYQDASRWILLSPELFFLSARRASDVRGYYFLSQINNLQNKFTNWASLEKPEQEQIKIWLLQMCFNVKMDDNQCNTDLNVAIAQKKLAQFYASSADYSQNLYQNLFVINPDYKRPELTVASSAEKFLFLLPFKDPGMTRILSFLKNNIEDEWRGSNWSLNLDFKTDETASPDSIAHLKFEAGVTPHVNALGGSEITMDANSLLDDYNTNWTIRHEFGHVLGFPDCYIEFYDETKGYMVSYQLDLNNIMCSRRGHILPTHFNQLKNIYAH